MKNSAPEPKRLLVVGSTSDGKSTLINALRDLANSEAAVAKKSAHGTTKVLKEHRGMPISGRDIIYIDTPGVGDGDVSVGTLLTLLEAKLSSQNPVDGILVTTPVTNASVSLGAQIVQFIVDKGFVGGAEKWANVILVGTKGDRAEPDEIDHFKVNVVPAMFAKSLGRQGTHAIVGFGDIGYEKLKEAISNLPNIKIGYKQPSEDDTASFLTEKLGVDFEKTKRELEEERKKRAIEAAQHRRHEEELEAKQQREIRKKNEEIRRYEQECKEIEKEKEKLEEENRRREAVLRKEREKAEEKERKLAEELAQRKLQEERDREEKIAKEDAERRRREEENRKVKDGDLVYVKFLKAGLYFADIPDYNGYAGSVGPRPQALRFTIAPCCDKSITDTAGGRSRKFNVGHMGIQLRHQGTDTGRCHKMDGWRCYYHSTTSGGKYDMNRPDNSKQFFLINGKDTEIQYGVPFRLYDMAYFGITCFRREDPVANNLNPSTGGQYWLSSKYQSVINKYAPMYEDLLVFERAS